MYFQEKLEKIIVKNNSLLSIGLDPELDKILNSLLSSKDPLFEFSKTIIDVTHDMVCAYKPQIANYSALGIDGLKSLIKTVSYLKKYYPDVPIILDAKRADIAKTSEKYAREVFDVIGADAVTVNPYFGLDALVPFLQRKEKGIVILCRTSNPSASDFQDLKVNGGEPLYLVVAKKVVQWNKKYHNCLMVVGATWPEQLQQVRKVAPEMFFLVPGIGTQGGNLQKTLQFGLTKNGSGLIIHSSSAIIYASSEKNFAQKARKAAETLRDEINKERRL